MHSVIGRDNTKNGPVFDKSVLPKIVALVMFGDPGFAATRAGGPGSTKPFPKNMFEKLRENCAPKDSVSD